MEKTQGTKISIVGAGFVGSTTAYALYLKGLASEMVIVDINKDKAEAEAMDMVQANGVVKPCNIHAGEYVDTKDSDIVIISAGLGQKPGETRLDLISKNLKIFKSIVPEIVKYNPNAIILVVSNPVDILTYITYKLSGFPANRVIGSGTVLDSSRLRYECSKHFDVDARNIHSYIIGEHGDSEIAAWSLSSIAGMPIEEYSKKVLGDSDLTFKKTIPETVKNAAYVLIQKKGYTNYAIGASVARIVEAILNDENAILPVSSLFTGQYGIEDIYLAIPTIVNGSGAEKIVNVDLSEDEQKRLQESANILKGHLTEAGI